MSRLPSGTKRCYQTGFPPAYIIRIVLNPYIYIISKYLP